MAICRFVLRMACTALVHTSSAWGSAVPEPIAEPLGTASSDTCGAVVSCVDVCTQLPFHYRAVRLASPGGLDAAWAPDSAQQCYGLSGGLRARVIPDDNGGLIAAWVDSRLGDADIYAQRLVGGEVAAGWPPDGLPVCTAPGSQYQLDALDDGEGGMFLAWLDHRSGRDADIYVDRVTDLGVARQHSFAVRRHPVLRTALPTRT